MVVSSQLPGAASGAGATEPANNKKYKAKPICSKQPRPVTLHREIFFLPPSLCF
jgi:hypothetical protein